MMGGMLGAADVSSELLMHKRKLVDMSLISLAGLSLQCCSQYEALKIKDRCHLRFASWGGGKDVSHALRMGPLVSQRNVGDVSVWRRVIHR